MKIAVIGLGLIGGSLGLGLKRLGSSDLRIIGIPRREETLKKAIEIGAVDEGTTDHVNGVVDADMVFICTPMHLIVPIIKEIAPKLKKGAIVTDVGSSKYGIVTQAEKAMPKGTYFVGGHPMAGKETTKLESSDPELFRGKTWILTRSSRTSVRALQEIEKLVGILGANPLEMDPKTHDRVVAAVSHMPLAVAASLVNTIADQEERELMERCASSGFRDTTRIASGDPILGVDMFTTNKKAILKMLGAFKKKVSELEKLIKSGDGEKVCEELEKAKRFRDSIYG